MNSKIVEDFKFVLSTEQGMRLVNWVLEFCGIYRQSMNEDTHKMAFFEGRRSVGLHLLRVFESEPELYIKFIQLRLKHERDDRTERELERSESTYHGPKSR